MSGCPCTNPPLKATRFICPFLSASLSLLLSQRLARAGIKLEGMPWDPGAEWDEDEGYEDEGAEVRDTALVYYACSFFGISREVDDRLLAHGHHSMRVGVLTPGECGDDRIPHRPKLGTHRGEYITSWRVFSGCAFVEKIVSDPAM